MEQEVTYSEQGNTQPEEIRCYSHVESNFAKRPPQHMPVNLVCNLLWTYGQRPKSQLYSSAPEASDLADHDEAVTG